MSGVRHPLALHLRLFGGFALPRLQHAGQGEQIRQNQFREAADGDQPVPVDLVWVMQGAVSDKPDGVRPLGKTGRDPVARSELFDPIVKGLAGKVRRVKLRPDIESSAILAGRRFLHFLLRKQELGCHQRLYDLIWQVVRDARLRHVRPHTDDVPPHLIEAQRVAPNIRAEHAAPVPIRYFESDRLPASAAARVHEVANHPLSSARRMRNNAHFEVHPGRKAAGMGALVNEGRHV